MNTRGKGDALDRRVYDQRQHYFYSMVVVSAFGQHRRATPQAAGHVELLWRHVVMVSRGFRFSRAPRIMTYDFRVSLCVTTQLVLLRSKLLPQPPISALTTTLSTLVDTAHSVVHRKMPMDLFCSASHSSNQCIKMAPSIASTTSFLLPLIALSTPGFM